MIKTARKSRKMIPVEEAIGRWHKAPGYRKAYDPLDEEFALVAQIVRAHARSGLTQAEIAKRMKTTPAAMARLESGSTMPSPRTLRRYAAATGHRFKDTRNNKRYI